MQEEVIVKIDKNGNVKVEVKGVKGGSCKSLTAALEAALGAVTADAPTAEMFQGGVSQQKHVQK